jgi:hypothetical protein
MDVFSWSYTVQSANDYKEKVNEYMYTHMLMTGED